MSAHPKRYYTLGEYVALEKAGEARYEYWDGEIVCMSGGSKAHGEISGNVYFALRLRLQGRACRPFNSEIPVKTPSLPPYRYPDASAVCGKAEFEKLHGIDVLTNPVLIVEVLSPRTEAADRKAKFDAYKSLKSLREYVLISQDAPHVTHFVKQAGGRWKRFDTADLTGSVKLSSIDCALALADIYQGVEFP